MGWLHYGRWHGIIHVPRATPRLSRTHHFYSLWWSLPRMFSFHARMRILQPFKRILVNLRQMPHYLHTGGGSARKKTSSGSLSALVNNYYSLCPWTHCRAAAITNAPASNIFCTIVIFRVSPPQCSLAFQVKSLVTSRCHLGRKLLAAMQLCANGCLNKSKLAASCMPKTKKP